MTIWVVMGGTGEYSDRDEWPVRAYGDKAKAEAEITRLSEEAKALFARTESQWYSDYARREVDAHREKCGDPSFRMDYTGTSYFYYEVELV